MILPQHFLDSLSGCPGFDASAFEEAHQIPSVSSIRYNSIKSNQHSSSFEGLKLADIPWCIDGVYLKDRPKFTLDPLLHAGAYYVQEASSMFLEHLIEEILPGASGLKLLDLCAAPGGKTTLLASMKQFDFVLANEIIASRIPMLYENLVKWGSSKTFISNNDPQHLTRLGSMFDVVLVDAPCSGSGLFRKDPQALHEWNSALVHFCSVRQQRILQHALELVKPGGFLIYSTCSYSIQENEHILDYIMKQGCVDSIPLGLLDSWNIIHSLSDKYAAHGYRFYPDKVMGEGFFCAVFQKHALVLNGGAAAFFNAPKTVTKQIELHDWINADDVVYIEELGGLVAVHKKHLALRNMLKHFLRMRKSGVKVGTVMKKGFIPDHELALSEWATSRQNQIELSKIDAIKYLKKEDINTDVYKDGTYLMKYQNFGMGWAKMINNRLKNNYPMNWRILMQSH